MIPQVGSPQNLMNHSAGFLIVALIIVMFAVIGAIYFTAVALLMNWFVSMYPRGAVYIVSVIAVAFSAVQAPLFAVTALSAFWFMFHVSP